MGLNNKYPCYQVTLKLPIDNILYSSLPVPTCQRHHNVQRSEEHGKVKETVAVRYFVLFVVPDRLMFLIATGRRTTCEEATSVDSPGLSYVKLTAARPLYTRIRHVREQAIEQIVTLTKLRG